MRSEEHRSPISLNGPWHFCMDPDGKKADDVVTGNPSFAWRKVIVPCDIAHACPEQPFYEGPCWFRRDLRISEAMRNKRVVLHFEAVNYISVIFVNGNFVGRNIHGFLPFEFDISEYVQYDVPNELVVMTDHRREHGELPSKFAWKNVGGIIRDVFYYVTDEAYIEDIRIQAALDGETSVAIRVDGKIPSGAQIRVELFEEDFRKQIAAHTCVAQANQTVTFHPDSIMLWSPEIPNLYRCKVCLTGNGINDAKETAFGYRLLEAKGDQILLNGKPYFLKGYNYHEDNVETGGAVCREISEADLRVMKESGANIIRCHYPHDRHVLDLADKLGLIGIAEIPLHAMYYRFDLLEHLGFNYDAKKARLRLNQVFLNAREMISLLMKRDWNHPSVCIWSVSNESNEEESVVCEINDALLQYVKDLDPGRLCTHVSMHAFITEENIDQVYQYDDVICLNIYPTVGRRLGERNLDRDMPDVQKIDRDAINWLKLHYPEKPVIITEFGYMTDRPFDGIISEDIQCECISTEFPVIRECAQGALVWLYADHPWPPTLISHGCDLSTYGLFRRDRTPKKAAEVYRQLLRDEGVTERQNES